MKSPIFDLATPHAEPSSLTAFAENALIRDTENRDDDCLERAFATEGVHCYAIADGRMILKHDRQVLDPLFAPYELAALDPDPDNAVLLGHRETGEPRIAMPSRSIRKTCRSFTRLPLHAASIARTFSKAPCWAKPRRPFRSSTGT